MKQSCTLTCSSLSQTVALSRFKETEPPQIHVKLLYRVGSLRNLNVHVEDMKMLRKLSELLHELVIVLGSGKSPDSGKLDYNNYSTCCHLKILTTEIM